MKKYEWEVRFNELDGEYYIEKLVNMNTPETLTVEQAAEKLNELEREIEILRIYMSKDTRAMADEHLAEIKSKAKVKEYLSQGYTPHETGMALNISVDEVLEIKEQK